jgi:hypothetical protein
MLEDVLIGIGRADGTDDAFANAGDDCFLRGAADEAVEVGADGDAGLDLDADAVLGNAIDAAAALGGVGAIDDLWIDASRDGFEDCFAGAAGGEIDGAATRALTVFSTLPPAR